jgi:hypothetical protein
VGSFTFAFLIFYFSFLIFQPTLFIFRQYMPETIIMKRLFYPFLLICVSVLSFNCQKELSFDRGTVNNNSNPINATLQGNIKDENGRPAMGVIIKVGAKTATTDARGYFRINNAALDKNASLVTAEKAGYFKAFRSFGATSGINQVTIQLLKKTLTGTVTTSSGGEVSLSNGSKVKLAANSIVKKSGGTYSGTVNVYATYIDPTSSNISELVPGSFMATDKNNKQVVLSSYGMLAVELESPVGEKLQVATGSIATLTTAIPVTLQASAPATIPLWYVDEQTGTWKEEGTATKSGNSYVGDVKHFSFWNCDIPFPYINLSMTVKNADGSALVFTPVKITAASTYGSAYGYTDSEGRVNGAVPSNMALVLEVLTQCYDVVYSQNIGPFASHTNLGTISVPANSNTTTVTGRLLNCNGAPVTQGRAMIIMDNITRYASTASDGTFSSTFYTCTGPLTACEVIGIDDAAQQQGVPVNVTIGYPTSAGGDISACGASSTEYINYSIDGVVTNISSLTPGDVFSSHSYDSSGLTVADIWGVRNGASMIFFEFAHNKTEGTFPVIRSYAWGFNQMSLVPVFTVTVTNYPDNIGQYFEGNFSGQFLDQNGASHTYVCSFRVRRQ